MSPSGPHGSGSPNRPKGRPKPDERWVAVDEYTTGHLHPESRANSAALSRTLEYSAEQHLPDIQSGRTFGKFLALQCRFGNVKHALEVGTLGGYSAIWMASQNPELRVTSIEYDPHHAEVARQNIERAGVADRVDIRIGAGVDILPQLLREIEEGKAERIGFCFIDADKLNNYTYLDFAVRMGHPGTCIVVDNVVQGGNVLNKENGFSEGARIVVEETGKDERVDAVVMQIVNERSYDGFLMAVVK